MLQGMEARRYTEREAPVALREAVACLWSSVSATDTTTLVLPDGCIDLIWEQGKGAYVAGPDTGAAPATSRGGAALFGVRFRPSAGGPVLGLPLSELRDRRVDLKDLLPADAKRLSGTLDPARAAELTLDLAGRLVADRAIDPAMAYAARMLRDPRVRTEHVAAEIGLSMRQLRRRSHDTVGYGPKTLQRILRFRRFVSSVDAGEKDLAAIAVEVGYADQAHLTRECAVLSGLTPAALARMRSAA